MYRHNEQTIKVKELIDSGVIGKLHLIRGEFTYPRQFCEGDIKRYPYTGRAWRFFLSSFPRPLVCPT